MSSLPVYVEPAGAAAADSALAILSDGYLELMTDFKQHIVKQDTVQGSSKAEVIAGGEHVVWKLDKWVWRLGVRPAEVYSWSRDGVALKLSDPNEKRKRAVSILDHMQKKTKEFATTGITPPEALLEYLYLCRDEPLPGPYDPAEELAQVRELRELLKLQQLRAADDVAELLQWFSQLCGYAREGHGACVVTLERMSCLGPDLLDELDSLRQSYLRGKERSENKKGLTEILSQVSGAIERFVLVASGEADMPWRVSADTKPENFVTVPRDSEAGQTSVAAIRLVDVDCFYHEGEVKRPSVQAPELFTLGKSLHVNPLPSELRKKQNAAALVVMHFLVFVCNWLRESGFESNRALRQDICCEQSCPWLGDQATILRSLELLGQIDRYYQTARVQGLTLIAGLTWTMQQHHSKFFTECCPVGTGQLYTCSYNYRLLSRLVTCGVCHKQSAGGALLGALDKFYSTVVQQSELRQVAKESSRFGKGRQAPAPELGGGSPLDSWGTPFDPAKPEAEVAVLPDQGTVAPVPTVLNRTSALRVGDLLTPDRIDILNITTQLKLGVDAQVAKELESSRSDRGVWERLKASVDEEILNTEALLQTEIQIFTEGDINKLVVSLRKLHQWLQTLSTEITRCANEDKKDNSFNFCLKPTGLSADTEKSAAQERKKKLELCTRVKELIETKLSEWNDNNRWQEALCWEPFTLYGLYLLFQKLRSSESHGGLPALYEKWSARAGCALHDLSYYILPLPSWALSWPHSDTQEYSSTDDLQKRFKNVNTFFKSAPLCRLLSKSMIDIQNFVKSPNIKPELQTEAPCRRKQLNHRFASMCKGTVHQCAGPVGSCGPQTRPTHTAPYAMARKPRRNRAPRLCASRLLQVLPAANSSKLTSTNPRLLKLRTCECAQKRRPVASFREFRGSLRARAVTTGLFVCKGCRGLRKITTPAQSQPYSTALECSSRRAKTSSDIWQQ